MRKSECRTYTEVNRLLYKLRILKAYCLRPYGIKRVCPLSG